MPVILLLDRLGKVKLVPRQRGPGFVKAGVVPGLMVTVIVVELAHCPPEGVKVYVVVAWLLMAGDHVPVIPFMEVVGKVNVPPGQIVPTGVNVGTTFGFTVTVVVSVVDAQLFTATE